MTDPITISSEILRLKAEYPILHDHSPLAIGVRTQLVPVINLNHRKSRQLIYALTHNHKYLKAIAAGGSRHNLDGSINGSITPDQMIHADTLLKARKGTSKADKPTTPAQHMFPEILTLKRA